MNTTHPVEDEVLPGVRKKLWCTGTRVTDSGHTLSPGQGGPASTALPRGRGRWLMASSDNLPDKSTCVPVSRTVHKEARVWECRQTMSRNTRREPTANVKPQSPATALWTCKPTLWLGVLSRSPHWSLLETSLSTVFRKGWRPPLLRDWWVKVLVSLIFSSQASQNFSGPGRRGDFYSVPSECHASC